MAGKKIEKSKTPFLDAVRELEWEAEQNKSKFDELLRKRGWKHVCDTPGALWMWEKKLPDGRTVLCDGGTALTFEEWLCGEEYEEND